MLTENAIKNTQLKLEVANRNIYNLITENTISKNNDKEKKFEHKMASVKLQKCKYDFLVFA